MRSDQKFEDRARQCEFQGGVDPDKKIDESAGRAVQAGVRIIAGAVVLAASCWACGLILGFGWSGIPGAAVWRVVISAPAGLALFALGGYAAFRLALV